MKTDIKRIAVFTSGGDAPGMNAAIRAVVRTASFHDLHVYGISRGYEGMIDGDFKRLERKDVANIIHRGGTILKTARSKRFMTPEGRKAAYESLRAFDIDACIAIGGNGTFTGANIFAQEHSIPIIGLPGTIDNDLYGTDYTIGFDTAVNTAIEAVDKIRDTADSHDRVFFVEVMGRHAGYIALHTGIGSGAESVVTPEINVSIEDVVGVLQRSAKRKKLFSLIIVAEGSTLGSANEIASKVNDRLPGAFDIRVAVIGHLQRGGAPSHLDRMLASRMGHAAVEGLVQGKADVMAGIVNDEIVYTPFYDSIYTEKTINNQLIKMAGILAM
jgi:6-phosphofructokinase 1